MRVPRTTDADGDEGLRRVGQAFLLARRSRGWSQRYLERQSGVPQSTISRLENGRRPTIPVSDLARLACTLGRVTIEPRDWLAIDQSLDQSLDG